MDRGPWKLWGGENVLLFDQGDRTFVKIELDKIGASHISEVHQFLKRRCLALEKRREWQKQGRLLFLQLC